MAHLKPGDAGGPKPEIPSSWQHPVLMITSNALALVEMRGIILSRANVIQHRWSYADECLGARRDRPYPADKATRRGGRRATPARQNPEPLDGARAARR